MGTISATSVGIAARVAANDTTTAHADDSAAATHAARGAAGHDAGATDEHDDAKATVWRAKSVWAHLLTWKGGFK